MQAQIFVAVGGFNEEGFATTAVGQNRRRDHFRQDPNGSWFEHNSHAPQSLSTCERPKNKHTVPLTSVPTWKRVKQGPSKGPHVQQFVHGSNAVRKLNQTFYPTQHHTILHPAHAEPPSFDAEFALCHVCFAVRLAAYEESPVPRGYASSTYFSFFLSRRYSIPDRDAQRSVGRDKKKDATYLPCASRTLLDCVTDAIRKTNASKALTSSHVDSAHDALQNVMLLNLLTNNWALVNA